jgi:hypothetical protein
MRVHTGSGDGLLPVAQWEARVRRGISRERRQEARSGTVHVVRTLRWHDDGTRAGRVGPMSPPWPRVPRRGRRSSHDRLEFSPCGDDRGPLDDGAARGMGSGQSSDHGPNRIVVHIDTVVPFGACVLAQPACKPRTRRRVAGSQPRQQGELSRSSVAILSRGLHSRRAGDLARRVVNPYSAGRAGPLVSECRLERRWCVVPS